MKKFLIAATVSALAFCQPALAKLHVFEFTVSIDSVGTIPLHTNTRIEADSTPAWMPNLTVNKGDQIKGTFSFEGTKAPWIASPDERYFGERLRANTAFSIDAKPLAQTATWAAISAGQYEEYREFQLEGAIDRGGASTTYTLTGPYDAAKPYTLDLASFATRRFEGTWTTGYVHPDNHFNVHFFSGAITSMVEVSPVPEPATYGMLLAGMALVGAAARKRQRTLHA